MTLVDLVTLVAGVALGFASVSNFGSVFLPVPFVLIVLAVTRLFQVMTIALAVVAFGRVASYRRMPRPAEWLAIVVSVSAVASWPEFNVDARVNDIIAAFPSSFDRLHFNGLRWVVAGLASSAILVTFAVLRLGRKAFPAWLKTLLLSLAALLARSGPIWTIGYIGDELFSPWGGFAADALGILYRESCELVGYFPTGVYFGLPAVAALLDRLAGRRWSWSEWMGGATSIMVIGLDLMFCPGEFTTIATSWLAEPALILAWFVSVAFASRWIVKKIGPPWQQWIEGPIDHDRSPSGSDSAANIL